MAPKKTPIPIGDSEDYWEFACGVELEAFDGYFPFAHRTGIFPDREGWYFYYYVEHHGRHIYKVRRQALLKDANELFSLLDQKVAESAQEYTTKYTLKDKNDRRLRCLKIKGLVSSNNDRFIDEISSNSLRSSDDAYEYDSFQIQWEKSKLYWATILFEALFLSFWWLFTFHSGVFGRYNSRVSSRLAFSPLIFFTPYFLGYAPFLFSYGDGGGVLYPVISFFIGFPFGFFPLNSVDVEVLKLLPKPLLYISQVPFSQSAVSFAGLISPTVLCVYAALVLMASKAVVKLFSYVKARTSADKDD